MNPPPNAGGVGTSLRAGLNAGMAAGLVLGLVDGLGAGLRTGTHGLLDWLGCLAAAGLVYGLVFAAMGLLLALVLHGWLRKFPLGERLSRVLALLLGLGLFVGLVWWTRPWVFPGLSVTDPKRLAVSAVLLPIGLALGFVFVRLGTRLPRGARWAGAALVPFAWLGGGVFLYSTSSDTGELGCVNERTRALPNVLLFVCDAMRADKLGCYGDPRVQTPRIDSLAKDGVVFERAFVQAPFTGSSFGSYFTGKYPRRHGFVRMAPDTRMAPNATIASHLKDATLVGGGALERDDYHCVTFMTGALSTSAGLARGFDRTSSRSWGTTWSTSTIPGACSARSCCCSSRARSSRRSSTPRRSRARPHAGCVPTETSAFSRWCTCSRRTRPTTRRPRSARSTTIRTTRGRSACSAPTTPSRSTRAERSRARPTSARSATCTTAA
jgi:hypothetical protein